MTTLSKKQGIAARLIAGGMMTAALSVIGAPAAEAANCGDLRNRGSLIVANVTAHNVTCRKAKSTIMRVFLPGMDLEGWSCNGYPRQKCRKGAKRIAFTYPGE